MKGITKRWLINSMGVIMAILLLIVVIFALFVQSFYYNGIMQTISGRSSEFANMFNKPDEFISTARVYVENFPDKELMELMVINSNGDVVITSTGFEPDKEQVMPDYEQAKYEKSEYTTWTGKLNSGENVMALTRMIYGNDDEYVGAVRYIVSLEEADRYS